MLDKLEAVNRCLRAIGEVRVTSLDSGLEDADDALAVIEEVLDEVLSSGWNCNTVWSKSFSPDDDGYIEMSSDYYQVEPNYKWTGGRLTVQYDPDDSILKLYQIDDETFVFDDDIELHVITYLDFESLPYHLRNYVSAVAARTFQERTIGSVSMDNFTSRKVSEAWAKVLDAESEIANNNALTDSAYMREITGRNNRLTWR